MPKSGKATSGQIEERIQAVIERLVAGESRAAIVRDIAKKYGVKSRMVDNYLARANKKLAQAAEHQREVELGKALLRLNALFYAAGTAGDHKTQLSVQRELNELLGLYSSGDGSLSGAYKIQLVEVRRP